MVETTRRRALAAVATAATAGLAGCSGVLGGTETEEEDEETDAGPPTVGDPSGDKVVTVRVTVEDEFGSPVDGATVVLRDTGGTLDEPQGTTGPNGKLVFHEGVGPAPCNPLELRLPEYGVRQDLGCKNGGVTLEHTFTVETSA